MNNRTDLNRGKVVYISIIFHIPASWLNLLNGYDFYFWQSDTTTLPRMDGSSIVYIGNRLTTGGRAVAAPAKQNLAVLPKRHDNGLFLQS